MNNAIQPFSMAGNADISNTPEESNKQEKGFKFRTVKKTDDSTSYLLATKEAKPSPENNRQVTKFDDVNSTNEKPDSSDSEIYHSTNEELGSSDSEMYYSADEEADKPFNIGQNLLANSASIYLQHSETVPEKSGNTVLSVKNEQLAECSISDKNKQPENSQFKCRTTLQNGFLHYKAFTEDGHMIIANSESSISSKIAVDIFLYDKNKPFQKKIHITSLDNANKLKAFYLNTHGSLILLFTDKSVVIGQINDNEWQEIACFHGEYKDRPLFSPDDKFIFLKNSSWPHVATWTVLKLDNNEKWVKEKNELFKDKHIFFGKSHSGELITTPVGPMEPEALCSPIPVIVYAPDSNGQFKETASISVDNPNGYGLLTCSKPDDDHIIIYMDYEYPYEGFSDNFVDEFIKTFERGSEGKWFESNEEKRDNPDATSHIKWISVSSDGSCHGISWHGRIITVWSRSDESECQNKGSFQPTYTSERSYAEGSSLSSDGHLCALLLTSESVQVWEAIDGGTWHKKGSFQAAPGAKKVEFSPDGSFIITNGCHTMADIWEVLPDNEDR